MNKRLCVTFLVCFTIGLMGCTGTHEEGEKSEALQLEEMKEVVFSNGVTAAVISSPENDEQSRSHLTNYLNDEETLYACFIQSMGSAEGIEELAKLENETDEEYAIRRRTQELEYLVDALQNKGFMVLEDYPFCYYNNEHLYNEQYGPVSGGDFLLLGECAIVGTYQQFMETFHGEEVVSGCRLTAIEAPRPDYVELMTQCGYTGKEDTGGVYVWSEYYHYDILNMLGGEYSVMEVSVLMPEQTK